MGAYFKAVSNSTNVFAEAISLAERIGENGGTDVLSVVDGNEFGEKGFIVTVEYYDNAKPNYVEVFKTKEEAVHYFNTLIR
jgi:hypothetical protein